MELYDRQKEVSTMVRRAVKEVDCALKNARLARRRALLDLITSAPMEELEEYELLIHDLRQGSNRL